MLDVSDIEIYNIIKNLNLNKARGGDGNSVKIRRKINSIVSPVITKLINQAYYEGKYLNSLKLLKVIPMFKSGSK